MPAQARKHTMFMAEAYQPIFREVGLDAAGIFTHPDIRVWRKLPDRENCTLDVNRPDGTSIRFHIKRFPREQSATIPADTEKRGYRALQMEGIPTASLVGWGTLLDRRSFVITENLAGFEAADKLIAGGLAFDRLLTPTADLTAKLHQSKLHHSDLYLCHFFAKVSGDAVDLRLIDAARVRRLASILTRRRWIVKDLAQFWYSTKSLPVTDAQRTAWLDRYAAACGLKLIAGLRRSIESKSNWIARHDLKLRKQQPNRNISIPNN